MQSFLTSVLHWTVWSVSRLGRFSPCRSSSCYALNRRFFYVLPIFVHMNRMYGLPPWNFRFGCYCYHYVENNAVSTWFWSASWLLLYTVSERENFIKSILWSVKDLQFGNHYVHVRNVTRKNPSIEIRVSFKYEIKCKELLILNGLRLAESV
jgi:hypothetical protein